MGKKMTASEFIDKATQLHKGKYDYSQINYVNSRTEVMIVCPIHGVFAQKPVYHLQGSGCPKCARIWSDEHRRNLQISSQKSRGMTTEEWVQRAKKIHGDKYDYSQTVYVNQRTDVKIICPKHGLFEQKADSHLRGFGCRLCGNESENRKGVHTWSDEQRRKITATCMFRYGTVRYLDSSDGKRKIAEIKSTSEFRRKMRQIISSDIVQSKTKATCQIRYGVDSPMQLETIIAKVNETKRKNGTWNTSVAEERMYDLLCKRFGSSNVVRQYKEQRYPFYCDFYISSLDLFIELNATWLHGGHWFDETCVSDVLRVKQWRKNIEAGKRFYTVAIDVWTVRDVKKRKTAIQNKLNYLVFWDNDLIDFMNWLFSDSLVLNNIF